MGEYARYMGQDIKIGTCESMYYLRADQAHNVTPLPGSVDPIRDAERLLFRFPFPYEDNRDPGDFEPFRTWGVWGIEVPNIDHYRTQFVSQRGFNVMLDCPESVAGQVFSDKFSTIHRNGYGGPVRIAYQRIWKGKLVTVAQCGGCEATYRYPDLSDVEPVIVAIRSNGDAYAHSDEQRQRLHHEIADRIEAGYTNPPAWVAERGKVSA